ncbi:MAG: four helix bundle protein [Vicinamibacterales bacterium]|nr:four helix bundle protein [Vicinamibacterales bacterium]
MARDPKKLEVFHQAHRLALEIYVLTAGFPPAERFGLQSQLRRAAVSIPCNIVEGCVRRGVRDYQRFLDIALGSAAEVRYLLELTDSLQLLQGERLDQCRECSDHLFRALQKLHTAVSSMSN